MDPLEDLVESLLEWDGPPRIVGTRQGARSLQTCSDVTQDFWRLWRESKDELRDLGVSVSKDEEENRFVVKWWRDTDEILDDDGDPFPEPVAQVVEIARAVLKAPPEFTSPYLKAYQLDPAYTLLTAAQCPEVKMTLDASDTGLGKTWVCLEVLKRLGWNFGVVCPANVVTKWTDTSMGLPFELEPEFVLSFDKLRTGKTPYVSRYSQRVRGKDKVRFEWEVNDNVVVVVDEIHTCSSADSLNGQLLRAAIDNPFIFVMGISATVADDPLNLKTIGYGLGLHDYHDHWEWCIRNGCRPGPFGGLLFNSGTTSTRKLTPNQVTARTKLKKIQAAIFPGRGCRVRKSELGAQLPPNTIMAESVDADWTSPLIKDALKELALKEEQDEVNAAAKDLPLSDLTLNTRARQRIELGKVSTFVSRGIHLLEQGNSVVMFLNYSETIDILRKAFVKTKFPFVSIVGGMTRPQLGETLRRFQSNEARLCICQTDAGSASIDLDDVTGEAPRCTLISPCYSAKKLIQALGRAHRTTTKSPVLQWILYGAEGVEERVCRIVQHKLNNISLLNDGDLSGISLGV